MISTILMRDQLMRILVHHSWGWLSKRFRPGRSVPPRRRFEPAGRRLAIESLEERTLLNGTWTALAHAQPAGATSGNMMLLSDGTVMVHANNNIFGTASNGNQWYRLTPDGTGSYVNGTWTQLASMNRVRLFFPSNVLPDGRVFVVGGEYSGSPRTQNFTNTGEIYNPVTNSWSNIANFPQSQFGDDPTEMLPDGSVLAGYISGPQTYIYHPATNTWTQTGTKLRSDRSDEETWIRLPVSSTLPQGGVLSYDIFSSISLGVGHAEVYNIATGTWVDTGNLPVQLSSSSVGDELGPGLLLPDGRVFLLGANSHTAYYTPATNTWTQGPDIPSGLAPDDAPAAELPNGKILFMADTPLFHGPAHIFEFDPNSGVSGTYTDVTPSISGLDLSDATTYNDSMLMLPAGQVLLATGTTRLAVYTPDGTPVANGKPTIAAIDSNADGSFTLTGTLLNGISEGAAYGDDEEMSSNYPIVRFSDDSGGVFYARTFNWSSTGVATGSTPATTQFTLPAGLAPGHYNVTVVANGIASDAFGLVVGQPKNSGLETPVLTAGTFQADPSGAQWVFSGTAGIASNGSSLTGSNPAPQGSQVGYVQDGGSFSQSVAMAASSPLHNYNISFQAAQGAANISPETFQVQVDGLAVETVTPASSTSYSLFNTVTFTATAGAHTISFVGLGSGGNAALIDQVRINQVVTGFGFETPSVTDFQQDPTGGPPALSYTGTAGIAANGSSLGNPDAPEGTQVGYIQGGGSIQGTGGIPNAGTYSLSFDAAGGGTEEFQVLVDGVVVFDFTPTGNMFASYTTSSFTVTAGSTHTIQFLGLGSGSSTVFLDQLQLIR
jgi:hypothetical protein